MPWEAPPAVILVLDDSLRHLDDEVSVDVGLVVTCECSGCFFAVDCWFGRREGGTESLADVSSLKL